MRTYVAATGAIFGILVIAHLLRVVEEGPHLLREPWWVLVTIAAAAFCIWSGALLWRRPRG